MLDTATLPRQLALPLPAFACFDPEPVLADESNAEALAWLARPEAWPQGRLALHGPPATGKSLLLRGLAARRGWPVLTGPALRGLPEVPAALGLALDDADCMAEEAALLHLLNLCAERGQLVLLAGRAPPARWPVALPDLRSRLRAMPAVGIRPPGDGLLAALLRRDFARRQLRVEDGVQAWLLARLPREAAAVAEAAARLDRAALACGGRVTRALARATLAELPGFGADDESMALAETGCPPTPTLL
ncbi:P-loop NTPase family protein [Belnapia rosea]|uniref:DnaA protein n=1 Tax=Belnapia rosea TaxID=938405 RepID=A0A1G6Y0T5_9PROT|nr:hypothetical protein [Belnapia rosea]SDB72795.1 hypothetical protein SAMN02927895_04548 [Belnapia rosea]SDD83920.1 hypothetical protein SAMN04487779_101356 [Belnapia rosea]